MVRLLCVISRNCESTASSVTISLNRPTFASSSAASTSSSRKNGDGRTWNTATSSAIAVSVFSPPESRFTFCSRLPGGDAMISMPASSTSSLSVSARLARPPRNSRGKFSEKRLLTASNVSRKRLRLRGIGDRRLPGRDLYAPLLADRFVEMPEPELALAQRQLGLRQRLAFPADRRAQLARGFLERRDLSRDALERLALRVVSHAR